MGKDRNHPLHKRLEKRDHFDDEDVSSNEFYTQHTFRFVNTI